MIQGITDKPWQAEARTAETNSGDIGIYVINLF